MSDPVAWLHTMLLPAQLGQVQREVLTFSQDSPFGVPGVNYPREIQVTSQPLYLNTKENE